MAYWMQIAALVKVGWCSASSRAEVPQRTPIVECLLIRWCDGAAFTDQDRHLRERFEKLRWERMQKPAGEVQEELGSTWVRYDVVELCCARW